MEAQPPVYHVAEEKEQAARRGHPCLGAFRLIRQQGNDEADDAGNAKPGRMAPPVAPIAKPEGGKRGGCDQCQGDRVERLRLYEQADHPWGEKKKKRQGEAVEQA